MALQPPLPLLQAALRPNVFHVLFNPPEVSSYLRNWTSAAGWVCRPCRLTPLAWKGPAGQTALVDKVLLTRNDDAHTVIKARARWLLLCSAHRARGWLHHCKLPRGLRFRTASGCALNAALLRKERCQGGRLRSVTCCHACLLQTRRCSRHAESRSQKGGFMHQVSCA
jgi:hypothetical protein